MGAGAKETLTSEDLNCIDAVKRVFSFANNFDEDALRA